MQIVLYLYWISDILLLLYGIPTTFDWLSPPKWMTELFHYGKCRDGRVENSMVKAIEIPKAWFKHYYIFGFIVSSFMATMTVSSFMFNHSLPGRELVETLADTEEAVIDKYAVMMVCLMMFVQHARRLYECQYISVYSKGTMNVLHYVLGFFLYSTVQLCAISDGPKLISRAEEDLSWKFDGLLASWNKVLGVVLFIWASYYHHDTHVILANLRKDSSGKKVLHRQHIIPSGGLFEYLSAPHFLCEILIYIAMGLVALQSWTFWMGPVLFTCTNQLLMIHETHKWYKKKFENYPTRYMVIPYIC